MLLYWDKTQEGFTLASPIHLLVNNNASACGATSGAAIEEQDFLTLMLHNDEDVCEKCIQLVTYSNW